MPSTERARLQQRDAELTSAATDVEHVAEITALGQDGVVHRIAAQLARDVALRCAA
jgi:hypothetical protein